MATVTVDKTTQRYSSAPQARPRMILLHTTEGWGWPPYSGGASAPHATITPIPNVGIKVREHRRWTDYGKALRNESGGVETNTSGVIQFEMVGTCYSGGPGYQWVKSDQVVLEALADYFRPIAALYGIPNHTLTFVPYPASYGNTPTRMTAAEWVKFRGWCGHQHAPENTHGDPGGFPIATLLRLVYSIPEDDMPYTPTQLEDIVVAATRRQIGNRVNKFGDPLTLEGATVIGHSEAEGANRNSTTTVGELATLETKVDALAAGVANLETLHAAIEALAVAIAALAPPPDPNAA